MWKLPLDASCCPRVCALWPSFERGTWLSGWGLNTGALSPHTFVLFNTMMEQREINSHNAKIYSINNFCVCITLGLCKCFHWPYPEIKSGHILRISSHLQTIHIVNIIIMEVMDGNMYGSRIDKNMSGSISCTCYFWGSIWVSTLENDLTFVGNTHFQSVILWNCKDNPESHAAKAWKYSSASCSTIHVTCRWSACLLSSEDSSLYQEFASPPT